MKDKSILFGFCLVALAVSAAAQTNVTNSNNGTSGTVPVYNGAASVTNSPISVSGSNVGIGTMSPGSTLDVITNGTGESMDPGDAVTYFGSLAFNREARTGAIFSSSAYAYQFTHTGSTTPGADWLALQVYNPTGTQITPQALVVNGNGNVGIGTTNPGAILEVNGNVKLTSGSGASVTYADGSVQTTAWNGVLNGGDYAEDMRATGKKEKYEPGDVLVLAEGDNTDVQESAEPYSTMVAGIYATKPGVVGRRNEVAKSADNVPMAMIGVVPTKVTAENGPIRKGDLLVTASVPGYAMKGTDRNRMLGAVLGKAMGSLDSGTGVVEVLVTLQ